jgi:hypothetical protein
MEQATFLYIIPADDYYWIKSFVDYQLIIYISLELILRVYQNFIYFFLQQYSDQCKGLIQSTLDYF